MSSKMSPAVEELATRFWKWRISDKPEFASFVGIHDTDDQLNDMSLASYQKRYDQCKVFLDQVLVALEGSPSRHADLVNLRVLKAELETYMVGFPLQGFLMPLNFMEGIHVDYKHLISWMVLKTVQDYEKLLSRYKQLPRQLSQIRELMEAGVARGIVNHAISMKNVGAGLGKFVVKAAEDSPLWAPLATLPDGFTQDQVLDIRTRAAHVITQLVSPAFLELQQYVETSYVTRPDIAITSIPGGQQFYAALVRFHTSTSLTPQEIHQMGLEEVQRIEAEMAKVVAELGHEMSVADFSSMIKKDSKFYYDDPEDLMASFRDIVYNQIQPRLSDVFANIPVTELKLQEYSSPDISHAFYLSGAYDGSRPGIYYVDTLQCETQPKHEMMTLSLHEGSPGHHHQSSHSIESPSMPYFRRTIEDSNYGQAPSRFPIHTAYMEGWALYAETLGFDMKLLQDPYVRFGHYTYEVFRACRLVVDTGMHALGWSRQRAIDYISAHSPSPLSKTKNEVDRYITLPGQALAYKIGQLKLTELRQKASETLGDAFDLKKFHEVVLESVGPLSLVEEEVNAWIAAGGRALD